MNERLYSMDRVYDVQCRNDPKLTVTVQRTGATTDRTLHNLQRQADRGHRFSLTSSPRLRSSLAIQKDYIAQSLTHNACRTEQLVKRCTISLMNLCLQFNALSPRDGRAGDRSTPRL